MAFCIVENKAPPDNNNRKTADENSLPNPRNRLSFEFARSFHFRNPIGWTRVVEGDILLQGSLICLVLVQYNTLFYESQLILD